jgi:hypothetical protein
VLAVEEPLEIRLGNMSYNLDAGFLVFEGIIWIQEVSALPWVVHHSRCSRVSPKGTASLRATVKESLSCWVTRIP